MSMSELYPQVLEIDVGESLHAMSFTASGEHLVAGSKKGVQVWRVKDGERVATMPLRCGVYCVATSNDGRWIAGGTKAGELLVWDAMTYKRVFVDGFKSAPILDVDFSPDSTRLISADGLLSTATIWDIATCRKVQSLHKDSDQGWLLSARYSPQGDRIATVTHESVRVWDGDDGRLLVDIKVLMKGLHDLLWCNDHLFIKTGDSKIMRINAATGSTVLELPVTCRDPFSCLLQHGKFIAYSAKKTVTFWNTVTHSQLTPILHTHNIRSITWTLDGQLFAISTERKIIIKDLSSVVLPFVSEPHIDYVTLNAWKRDQLTNAEALLSAAIPTSGSRAYHVLASRALVRARLGQWDAAVVDAEKSLQVQRSVIGYIAKCVAHVGKGDILAGCRACDIALLHFPSDHTSLLLLIKAVVLFMAGERGDAISRMDDLITDMRFDPALYVVRAYMHLLLGNLYMESVNYECAIKSFEDARIKLGNRTCQPPLIVTLISGWRFDDLAITIEQRLCEALLAVGSAKEAGESISRMIHRETSLTESIKTWVFDFKHRCRSELEDLGDNAVNAKQYDKAVSLYTAALSLDPASPQDLLVKRSKACTQKGEWKDALDDANKAINLDSSSPLGYERKYAALHGMERHDGAIGAFETMLSTMSESSDPEIRERSRHFVWPEQTRREIRTTIKNAIRDSPSVLIDTLSGRLCNKSEQATAFESTPAFSRLIASMTTHIDHALIEQVVGDFYRYATFSHTWEGNEPLYGKVINIVVYDLETSPTHEKLQMFCKIVREDGFNWAWSDTCCIDKGDLFVLQEALVSMFKWYEGSALTIIFLCDVDRLAELGALTMSVWNSRGWTLQEYHASKVVRIYTKDWTPYLHLTLHNHKESPEIVSEMEEATGIKAEVLRGLRPGLNYIRQKLCLASTRQTTRVEDAAYSLLGIFSVTLPVTYGEGDKALGRLLSQLLMSSGDTSILAWTGTSGSFNSCFPTDIAVFSQPLTSHIPPVTPDTEMQKAVTRLHASFLNVNLVMALYDHVDRLSTPTFAGQRMRLPCLAFKIRSISPFQNGSEFIFRVQADALGVVEIKTKQNLTRLESLCLIHPWIDFLLDRHAARNIAEITPEKDEISELEGFPSFDSFPDLSSTLHADPPDTPPPPSLAAQLPMDAQMRAYEFLARLRQPFGALLLTSTRRNIAEYRRIATESSIMVQVEEITSVTLDMLLQGVRVLDVL